ncbi:FAD-binding protein [Planctomycetota bacterium]
MRRQIEEQLPHYMRWESVSSLVGSRKTESLVARVSSEAECREVLAFCERNALTLCPRGSGHSYGDLALNDGAVLLNTTGMDRIFDFDETTGRITVQGGTKIIDIYRHVHDRGWALPASPTESIITVAGAIAVNVNGKDAWRVGNFGAQVLQLKLLTATGAVLCIDRDNDRDLFLAVVGGLGLLGIVLEVTLQLRKVPSPYLEIVRRPVRNVDALLDEMKQVEATCDFAVVWVDTCARGASLGRGVIHATKWIERPATRKQRHVEVMAGLQRLAMRRRQALALFEVMGFVISFFLEIQKVSVRFFNRLYYEYSKLRRSLGTADNVEMFLRYNFNASFTVPPAATVCGPHGYTIQVTFPRARAREAITALTEICQASPCPPVTTILRVHRSDDHLISFCEDGYSLNFEFHPKRRHLECMQGCVNQLLAGVIRFGGKVHLAKDMVLTHDQCLGLFPNVPAFLRVKQQLDPKQLFTSDLYRRLLQTKDQ